MLTRAHDSTRDPETITIDERRAEVASMLARGVVRAVRDGALGGLIPPETPQNRRQQDLIPRRI